MDDSVPLSIPYIAGNAEKYLCECVRTGFVSSVGAFVSQLEETLATMTGSDHCVAVMNGTSALHLALRCCEVGSGQEVIAPCLSFIATINPIQYLGASPVLIDVRSDTFTIDCSLVEEFLRKDCNASGHRLVNRHSGREVVGVIPVHVFGQPSELPQLKELCDEFGLFLIEDSAESLGAKLNGATLGAFGKATALSFNGNKTFTSGAGGALLTNDSELHSMALHLSTQAKADPLAYSHDQVGYNFRMSNIQAALGLSQLELSEEFLTKKAQIAELYRTELQPLVNQGLLSFQSAVSGTTSSCWLNVLIFHLPNSISEPSPWRGYVEHFKDQKIETRPIWQPLHISRPYSNVQRKGGRVAEELHRTGLCIPSSVGLTEQQQERVIAAVRELCRKGS